MTLGPADTAATRLADALRTSDLSSLASLSPVDRRDRFLALLTIYDLHTAPLHALGEAVRLQGHPAIAELKARLEEPWLTELDRLWESVEPEEDPSTVDGAVRWLRGIAVEDRLPPAYHWLAGEATQPQLLEFLALEGGPDAGFDDLVAICQVGMAGEAKLELGKNYWDEMGNGRLADVHTQLHHDVIAALSLPTVPRSEQPVEALERAALNGLLATNRWLQPEMIGALGLTELQAGPRCRMVLKAFDRLGVSRDAYPFYEVHADVDPVHGKDWVEKVVMPTVAQWPEWGERILRGAVWRARINLAFFAAAHLRLAEATSRAA